MSTELRDLKLIELEAPSLNYDARVQSACTAFDPQMYEVIDATGVVRFIPNIMGLTDSNLVDILAWQFHVDFYDHRKSLEFRKRLVQLSIQWHITKGTYQLVQDVLDTYWPGGATLLEWFNYYDPLPPGKPPDPPGGDLPESPIIVPPPPGGSWHDRYRFRIYVDEQIIDPADEAAVLTLIEHYKPISRWCEGVFRATTADCHIAWAGAMLRFVIHESDEPVIRPFIPDQYALLGPTFGSAGAVSDVFTVGVLPGGFFPGGPVTVTPSDGGAGGTFTPASVEISTANPTAKFSYTPPGGGSHPITTTNDGGLTDPPPITYVVQEVPQTIPGLLAWWDSEAIPAGTADGTPITLIPDKSGTGRDAPAITPAIYYSNIARGLLDVLPRVEFMKPEIQALLANPKVASHPALYFATGANSCYSFPTINMAGGYTVFAVAYWGANGNYRTLSQASGAPAPEVFDCDGPYGYLCDAGYRFSFDSTHDAFSVWTLESDLATAFHFKVWKNGISKPVAYNGPWAAGTTLDRIGIRGDGSPCNAAWFVATFVYAGILSDADRMTMENYLMGRFGIAPTLEKQK
jgi:hypothetical protein